MPQLTLVSIPIQATQEGEYLQHRDGIGFQVSEFDAVEVTYIIKKT